MKYIASVSFGKDSLAMLLRLIEEEKPVDEVVFFDTGMEFDCIYTLMVQVQELLKEKHIKFTRLKADQNFLHLMLDHEIKHRDGTRSCGYAWCGGKCRWYTTYKVRAIRQYLKQYPEYIEYIGIASDEKERIERNNGKLMPLVEWGMSEADCLAYCHAHGFRWMQGERELYADLDRVSCWCCRNKNLKELRNIFEHHKVYWLALCELERRCSMTMKNKPLPELEEQWKKEGKQIGFDDLLWKVEEKEEDGRDGKEKRN